MKKHTFKVGDRVIFESCLGPGSSYWRKGVILSEDAKYYYVLRDDGIEGLTNPPGYAAIKVKTKHDTDFQVGDWVRYEGIHPRVVSPLLEGKIGQIDYLSGDSCAGISQFHMQSGGIVYKENLVKIQPPHVMFNNCIIYNYLPQEAQVKPIKIKHEKYGVVEGVNVLQGGLDYGFTKDGAHYFVGNGWSQVPEVEWVTIQVEKNGFDRLKMYEKLYGYSDDALSCNQFTKWRYPQ